MRFRRREPPTTIEEFIRQVLLAADLPADDAARVRADLHAHFEDGLAEGVPAEELMQRFGNPEGAGRRVAAERRAARYGAAAPPAASVCTKASAHCLAKARTRPI